MRGSLALSLATVPLSFLTNVALGRTSPQALGYYSAIQVFVGTYYTFLVFGGIYVFTRFVPGLHRKDRAAFALSYTATVASFSALALVALFLFLPRLAHEILSRFGSPPPALAVGLLGVSLVWGFGSYLLFSVLDSTRATAVEKSIVIGFFIAAALGFGPLRARLTGDPSAYLWWSALWIYAAGAILAVVLVWRAAEIQPPTPIRWILPRGFWSTVVYAHLDTIVNYVYTTLSPVLVLLWLDVSSLGRFHAALRYVLLVSLLPGTMSSVIAPATSRLDASGLRSEALRQAAAAMRTAGVAVVPAALVLIFFADDAMRVFGPEFSGSGDILRIAAVSLAATPAVNLGSGLLAGLGAFRSYLAASSVYVLVAFAGTATLVPIGGVRGAALALTLGALARQVAIILVLRFRLGFPWPGRLAAGWVCTAAAAGLAMTVRPGRPAAAALVLILTASFAVAGRVTFGEIRELARRLRKGA